MADQLITCPNCGTKIPLTEAFTHDIEEKLRSQYEAELKKKTEESAATLKAKEKELQDILVKERSKLKLEAEQTAKESVSMELIDLEQQIAEKNKQLEKSKSEELELRKKQRELEDKSRDLNLEIERTLDAERNKIREEAEIKVAEEHRFKEMETEKQLDGMRRQIEDLKRKAELTSQQAQGEVQEIALEETLRSIYLFDLIEEVGKGVRGADVIQTVRNKYGADCGRILYESKRTKHFGNDWIEKLKADALLVKADICVIVTEAMPESIDKIGHINGIWICRFEDIKGLSLVLRESLVLLQSVAISQSNKGEKMQMLYDYLTSTEFKLQVGSIIEGFTDLQESYIQEKRAMERIWKQREKQLEKVLLNTNHFIGSIQGIAGSSIPELKQIGAADNILDLGE
jgi:hypothetical protein